MSSGSYFPPPVKTVEIPKKNGGIRILVVPTVGVVMQNGLPFDVKISHNEPLAFEDLTTEEFNNEIEKGFNDLRSGRVVSADKVAEANH